MAFILAPGVTPESYLRKGNLILHSGRVVHCKREVYDVLIDRSTKWGNPYSHKVGTKALYLVKTREEAIERYEEYLLSNPELLAALPELRGKVLGCWCHPLRCHGHVLVRFAAEEAFEEAGGRWPAPIPSTC
jgi:hypothetical protein